MAIERVDLPYVALEKEAKLARLFGFHRHMENSVADE